VPAAVPTEASVAPKSHRRSVIIGIVVVVLVAAVVIPGLFVFDAATAAIASGNGTATITWTPASDNGDTLGNPAQTFSGSINGNALSGLATFTIPTESGNPALGSTPTSKELPYFHYKGSYAGKPFVLVVDVNLQNESFVANGRYDGQAVYAVIGPAGGSGLGNSPIPFHGTIGSWQVTGTVNFPTGSGRQTATATFKVSS
jgi:hypothetical protein